MLHRGRALRAGLPVDPVTSGSRTARLSVPDKEWGPAERGMRMGSSSAVTRSARRASRLTAPPTQVIDPAKESRSDKTKLEWATNI